MKKEASRYDSVLRAQVALLRPVHGSMEVTVLPSRFIHLQLLDELWLYCFDADGNAIEFPFGTREGKIEEKMEIVFRTDARIHRPPFRIEIRHQIETEKMEDYTFTFFYEEI
jgi:hypothetical protein